MNEQKPICLITSAIPPILGVLALIADIVIDRSRPREAGLIGDNNMFQGTAVPFYTLASIILFGLVFTSLSIIRRERFREIAVVCFIVYITPVLLLAALYLDGLRYTKNLISDEPTKIDASK